MGVRTKQATTICTAAAALKAFDQMIEYQRLAERAKDKALSYTGGTMSQRKHWDRYDAYCVAAEGYATAMREWLSR